MIATEKNKN